MLTACSDGSRDGNVASLVTGSEGDWPRRVAELLVEPNRLARMKDLTALLEALPADRYPELARALEMLPVVPRVEDVGLVLHAWARLDPEAAYAQALEWRRRKIQWADPIPNYLVAEVVFVWAQDPFAQVEEFLVDVPGSLQGMLQGPLLRGWAESGQTKRATNFLKSQTEAGGTSQVLVTLFAGRLVHREGAEAAIEWAESLEESKLRTFAFRRTAEVIARVDPERATAWVEKHLGQPYAWGMARRVARSWVRRGEGARALEWIDGIELGDERESATQWSYEAWVMLDRDEAMVWAQNRATFPPSLRRHLWPHMRALVKRNPEEAVAWIRGFADQETQPALELGLAHMWLQEDREAAEVWIRDEGLEEAVAASAAQRAKAREERMRKPAVGMPTIEQQP